MTLFRLARVCVILGALASSAAACSSSSPRADGAADAKRAGDVMADDGMADVIATPDAVDVSIPADAVSPADAPGGSDVADAPAPFDVVIPVDDGSSIDVVIPADVVSPIDVTPVDVVTPADAMVPMDGTRADLVRPGDAGAPCIVDTDCKGTGLRCGYLITDACSAKGTCVMTPAPLPCGAIVHASGCGCDGTTVGWTGGCRPDFPDAYAPAAISHTGACP
jgi:hypothetical protein